MSGSRESDTRGAVVIGCSSGGLTALSELLPAFAVDFPLPIVVVQHRAADSDDFVIEHLDRLCQLRVKEALEKEPLVAGNVYFAPPNYHLLVESDYRFSLDCDDKVRCSRPSIDVLFMSAADAFTDRLIGVLLTGANDDGRDGICYIKARGGMTLAQDPQSAEVDIMPRAAIDSGMVDQAAPLSELRTTICEAAGC